MFLHVVVGLKWYGFGMNKKQCVISHGIGIEDCICALRSGHRNGRIFECNNCLKLLPVKIHQNVLVVH